MKHRAVLDPDMVAALAAPIAAAIIGRHPGEMPSERVVAAASVRYARQILFVARADPGSWWLHDDQTADVEEAPG
jgi:hypothetical protein